MNRAAPYILVFFLSIQGCFAQDDLRKVFSEFATSSRQQYNDYTIRSNREFSKALREYWDAFNVFEAKVKAPLKPVSDTLVPPCPIENEQIDISEAAVVYRKENKSAVVTDAVLQFDNLSGTLPLKRNVSFVFFGRKVTCYVPSSYGRLRLDGISEKAVSSFWEALSQKDVGGMVTSLKADRKELNLNHWALFEYVRALSREVFPEEASNERSLFTVFCMNQLGLNCKVARAGSSLLPLFASAQQIYGRRYVVVEGKNFYFADASANISKLNTYSVQMPRSGADMDMFVTSNPKIGDGGESLQEMVSSVFSGTFSLPLNTSLMSFYGDYPQLDVNVYASAEPSQKFSAALLEAIRPFLERKSGVEALNTLLAFVQQDFRYRSDTDQFGKEKPYFCEENFYYPYNDCEDRAVLFSFLVRKILGFDCLLLEYSDHVNCAVKIDREVDGYFVRRGPDKYYVCDPTCRGAKVGMSGKNYRVKPEKVWIL